MTRIFAVHENRCKRQYFFEYPSYLFGDARYRPHRRKREFSRHTSVLTALVTLTNKSGCVL